MSDTSISRLSSDKTPDKPPGPGALRPYWQVTFAAFIGWFLDAFDQTSLMFTLPDIARDFGCNIASLGSVLLGQAAGRFVGNTSWGWLADHYGRKPAFMLGVLWFAIFSAMTGLSHNLWSLMIIQFLFGVGFGGEWTASATLLMETVPGLLRPMASALMMSGYEVGYFAAAAAQAFILPHYGWRMLFFIGIIPALLSLFIRARVKESPVWLATRRQPALAAKPDNSNAGISHKIAGFDFGAAAFQAVGLMSFLQFQKAAIYTFYPTILRDSQHLPPQALFWPITLYCLGSVIGKLLCGRLAEHFGDRKIMISAIFIVMLVIWPFLSPGSWTVLLLSALIMGGAASGIFALVPHYLAQRFSARQRSFGMGASYAVGSLGQGLASKFVPLLGPSAASLPLSAIGFVLGTSMVSAIILAIKPGKMPDY